MIHILYHICNFIPFIQSPSPSVHFLFNIALFCERAFLFQFAISLEEDLLVLGLPSLGDPWIGLLIHVYLDLIYFRNKSYLQKFLGFLQYNIL